MNGVAAAVAAAEEPLSLQIPHCAPRSTYKDIIVMWRPGEDKPWTPLDTKECSSEEVKVRGGVREGVRGGVRGEGGGGGGGVRRGVRRGVRVEDREKLGGLM